MMTSRGRVAEHWAFSPARTKLSADDPEPFLYPHALSNNLGTRTYIFYIDLKLPFKPSLFNTLGERLLPVSQPRRTGCQHRRR